MPLCVMSVELLCLMSATLLLVNGLPLDGLNRNMIQDDDIPESAVPNNLRQWQKERQRRDLIPVASLSSEMSPSMDDQLGDIDSLYDPFRLVELALEPDLTSDSMPMDAPDSSYSNVAKRQQGWHNPYGKRAGTKRAASSHSSKMSSVYGHLLDLTDDGQYHTRPQDASEDVTGREIVAKRQQGWHNPYGKRGLKTVTQLSSKEPASAMVNDKFDARVVIFELLKLLGADDRSSVTEIDEMDNANRAYDDDDDDSASIKQRRGSRNYSSLSHIGSRITKRELVLLKQRLRRLYRTPKSVLNHAKVASTQLISSSYDSIPMSENVDGAQQLILS